MVTLDMRPLSSMADYLVIASGTNDRQVQAIADRIVDGVAKKQKRKPLGIEGTENAHWILVDYGDVICHVFLDTARDFYRLEDMWYDARRVHFKTQKKK